MHCCTTKLSAPPRRAHAHSHASLYRRLAAALQWAIPLTTLALIPKCPACIAGFILLFTGLGLSFPAAATIRWTIITLCILTILTLTIRWLLHLRANSHPQLPHA